MNQNGATDSISAPAHGSRRRSSMLAAQVLEAIRETDEEIFEETLHYDFVALGAGVAGGYWADVSVKHGLTYKLLCLGRPAYSRIIHQVSLDVWVVQYGRRQ